ncbi:hypothetical protein KIN20_010573 [Parelaphostrongylus tenuis]|uniref:NTR domain-containing protein n=1 Tax=Parelaphostrongylus tenuis TaxID=148309 RepID=A0AAD5QP79_PARTN|nr:hypothetical protein KIN20_010573 [Parelaphostrongylus tenuis]
MDETKASMTTFEQFNSATIIQKVFLRVVVDQQNSFEYLPLLSFAFTPAVELCGVEMEAGKEYLLTGYPIGRSLFLHGCSQVTDRSEIGALEWHTVSQELRANLTEFQC